MIALRTAVGGLLVGASCAVAQSAVKSEVQQHIDKVTTCLPPAVVVKGEPPDCKLLLQRMAELHVNGLSIAVVHHGVIEWAQGFGATEVGGKPVTAETLFQAGSISKPVASLGTLRLVQQRKLSLDANINTELTSWKIPANPAFPGAVVTLRELMTHTAGMTVHGFPGYAAGEPVPTLVQVLDGVKPANTPAIRIETMPGTKWNYSGGGITVMQQAVVDVVKEPYPKFLHDMVLAPIGMTHSTYEQPLPAAMKANEATPYDSKGVAVVGGAHTYPEMAAAGLWTTAADLAKYILEVQHSLAGKANHVLSREMTEQMLRPGMGKWGLGVETGGSSGAPYFTHGGVNEGFESLFVGYEHEGEGAVVMTNAQGGSQIAEQIMSSIAVAYGWPDLKPVERTEVKVEPAVLAKYVGTYDVAPIGNFVFTLEGDQLMGKPPGQEKDPVFPESPTRFFLKTGPAELEFFSEDAGKVTYVKLYFRGSEFKGVKQ
jgi:CubicO group peptidase (beta-lactamase class C family)